METPTPETKTTLPVTCERCRYWEAIKQVGSGNPVCTCSDSTRYLFHTGAADRCGFFKRKT